MVTGMPSAQTGSETAPDPAATTRPTYTGGPVELRVHGVSGTAPEALLDRPLVTQIGGDGIAGFYRPRLPDERTDNRPHPFNGARTPAPELEGYNWGGLTSGSPGRALWLFLLPATLINIAPRARPLPEQDSKALTYLTWLFSRWLALALTLLFVVTTAGISVNLAGWQCTYSDACEGASNNAVVGPIFGSWEPGAGRSGGWPPEVMLLSGALIPLLALFGLWLVSKRTIDRYESVSTDIPRIEAARNEVETNLESPWMWRNERQVRRLRATHMQAGIATVIWVASEAASPVALGSLVWPWNWGESDWRSVLVALLAGLVLAYSFVTLLFPSYVGHGRSARWQTASFVVWVVLVVAGVLSTLDLLIGGITRRSRLDAPGQHSSLPGFEGNLWAVVLLMFGLMVALIVVVLLQSLRASKQAPSGSQQAALKPGLGGLAAAALAAAAVLVGAMFSASAYTIAAAWLHTGSLKPGPSQVRRALAEFAVPDTFRVATFVFVISVVFAALAVVVALALLAWGFGFTVKMRGRTWRLRTARVVSGAVAQDYGAGTDADTDNGDHNGRRRGIERAMYAGALLECVLIFAFVLIVVGVVLTLGGASLLVGADGLDWSFAQEQMDELHGKGARWIPEAEGWGAYAAVLSYLLLIGVAALAFRVPTTRRVVGIIWDVAAFWPRACHPLAAPCYAERTVPDLVTRLHHFRTVEDRPVVLAGHSQGSVLSAAALFNLRGHEDGQDCVDGIALLTFGCVLRRLYARYFPVYFGPDRLHSLQEILATDPAKPDDPRWINLWRYTDYLGGQVTQGPPQPVAVNPQNVVVNGLLAEPPTTGPTSWEWHSPDPPYWERRVGTTTYSNPGRHSNFWSDESGIFQLAVTRLLDKA
jgi:hypothetical protein